MDAEYTPLEVSERLARSEIQLVDVRHANERDAGRIAGSVHIELAELPSRAEEIDRDLPVVFYCRSGARSGLATDAFRNAGFEAHNMAGGLLEWRAAGLPLDPADGHVAES